MFPYYHYPAPSDSEYLRALAEERAAREQYAAARRAQEEARQRAARARAARRACLSPYNSYYYDDDYNVMDLGMGLDDPAYYPRQRPSSYIDDRRPHGYGFNQYDQRALLEEQRRRELLEEQRRGELLELERERERRRLEEERIRRILQEERQREEAARQKMLEEERLRRAIEEEKLRRATEEERIRRALREEEEARRERARPEALSQQAALEPLLRALGFVPATSGSDSELDKERMGRQPRTQTSRRTGAPSPSPIRPFPFGRPSKPNDPVPDVKASSSTTTTIPITSPKPASKPATPTPKSTARELSPQPTAEQITAAERIQEAYRSYSSRKQALRAVASLRKRFLAARNGFSLPSSLDYDIPTNGRVPTSVTIDPATALLSPSSLESQDPFENVPKLAYTPRNAPLHAYEEELNRILSSLDAVESRGDQGVRMARRELARIVEREAERVERWRAVVWNWWTQHQAEQEKTSPAQSDEPSDPVDIPASNHNAEVVLETAESSEQAMEVEPAEQLTADVSIPSDPERRMEVQQSSGPTEPVFVSSATSPQDSPTVPLPGPVSAVDQAASPAPEVEIADAEEVNEPAIVVEHPSRTEPDLIPLAAHLSSDSDIVSARPSTPGLSHEPSEAEVEMEVEPEEVQTPPPAEHTPLVAVHPDSPVPPKQEATKLKDHLPSADTDWHELLQKDMF